MKRRLHLWDWVRQEDGYTFSLNMALLSVTVGMILLLILAWLAAGLVAGTDLRRAAAAAALAAQSQVTQTVTGSSAGFLTQAEWSLMGTVNAAATEVFDEEVNDKHLAQVFSNLSLETGISGNQVTVTASGDFLPLFLQTAAARVPGLQAMAVPMKTVVPVNYPVVGKG